MGVIAFNISKGVLDIRLTGDYQNQDLPEDVFTAIEKHHITRISVQASDVKQWDSSLLAFLLKLNKTAQLFEIKIEMKELPAGVKELLVLSQTVPVATKTQDVAKEDFFGTIGGFCLRLHQSFHKGFDFVVRQMVSLFSSVFHKTNSRRVDFLFALQECGPQAVPIVALISFMVGLILAFVGAIQLQMFGAQIYIASLVTIGMTRIMAAIMVGIIMAGRTGASFAATIGTMQVNEEIDALKTMGIDAEQFLVLPRLKALIITMPLLTMLADFAGILGGAAVGILALDIPYSEFFKYVQNAWFLKHFFVGLFHALVFGFIIAFSGCYFGMNCGRDADSVGKCTTSAVVYAIVWMIVATGIITFCLQRMGI